MEEAERRIIYPFTAIVGQDLAKLALLCVAINPTIGGVLLSGEKGTGKSTLVRGLADLLPEIEVVDGCPFNCNPRNPLEMCDECYRKYLNDKSSLRIVKRKMRVVDLPLSITVDRLVGTLDIKRALKEGIRALQPGLLAEANRNILYIDEVNLLDDYIADILLDSAAMGWNIIEREGISVKHPARFILIGTMNPEEGELRPQILDRFGLYVSIEAVKDPKHRIEIVKRVEEFHKDPLSFYDKYREEQRKLRERIIKAREILNDVEINDELLELLSKTIVNMGIKTHRAEIVTVKTAKAIAALNGRKYVNLEDLKKAMELALPHRVKARPFEQSKEDRKSSMLNRYLDAAKVKPLEKSNNLSDSSKGWRGYDVSGSDRRMDDKLGDRSKIFKPLDVDLNLDIDDKSVDRYSIARYKGSRSEIATVINWPHGYPISYIQPVGDSDNLDVDILGTIYTAVLRNPKLPIEISDEDIRVRVRKARIPRLLMIILDSSGSMAAMERIRLAKTICKEFIENAYVKRDRIGLIYFRGYDAVIAVPPTKLYNHVLNSLMNIPTGGRTPLSAALFKLLQIIKGFKFKNRYAAIKCVLITDGKANVPLYSDSIEDELTRLATAIKQYDVDFEIYDTRVGIELAPSYIDLLADILNAKVYKLS